MLLEVYAMKFTNFEIHASPFLLNAFCKDCGKSLKEVSNGWFSSALYCKDCKVVYEIKAVKIPAHKISKEFLDQCEKGIETENKINELRKRINEGKV
jgi:DNA-directed RNA polymerase subunit M/transcription elongation factor TFIIS